MTTTDSAVQKFDISIKFGQMSRSDGALPGSLAYIFRRAQADSGISDGEFCGRLAGYVLETMPDAPTSVRNTTLADMSRRYNGVDMSWTDFLTAMALLGYGKVGMTFA